MRRREFHGQWLQVPGFPEYWVSPCGAVSSRQFKTAWLMSPGNSRKGYRSVRLRDETGRYITHYVHRLVLLCVRGKAPSELHEGAHLDGNPPNNRFTNLEWVTRSANHQHKLIHGTMPIGEAHANAALTDSRVREMRLARAQGESLQSITDRIGVARMTVYRAITGRSWSHIK